MSAEIAEFSVKMTSLHNNHVLVTKRSPALDTHEFFSFISLNMAAAVQHFVGDTPVDSISSEATRKIPDDELAKKEAERLSKGEQKDPGAGKRAGAASRNPDGERRFLTADP